MWAPATLTVRSSSSTHANRREHHGAHARPATWTHHSPQVRLLADGLLRTVAEENLLWANDAGRRRLLCLLLKHWYPVDFCSDSAYDIIMEGGVGKDGLLQSVVHESLQHPMTLVSCKSTDCALVLNRPCLRHMNINFRRGLRLAAASTGLKPVIGPSRPSSELKLRESTAYSS